MPFTFSHPAIVLPLLKIPPKYICPSALIIGSMSPDFEYFIKMRLHQQHGHSLAGAFYYDLPVTLISLLVFHFFVRDTLINHLPVFLRKKYQAYAGINWFGYARKHWLVIICSALLGIFSHLFWDAFTHAPGYFVQFIPFLQKTITVFNVNVPSYDLMQLISTFAGGLVIMVYVLWPTNNFFAGQEWLRTLKYILIVSIISILVLLIRHADTQSEFIATVLSGGLIGMILAPMVLKLQDYVLKSRVSAEKTDGD